MGVISPPAMTRPAPAPDDPFRPWVGHVIGVWRLDGDRFTPELDDDPDEMTGFLIDEAKLVQDANGNEVVASTQFAHPPVDETGAAIEWVPPGSMTLLPPLFGSRQARVIACALGDAGDMPVPSHYELALE